MSSLLRLSICLLTRNEEHNIERVLRSLAGLGDEIILADTGSTDRTVELAQNFGARVVQVPWDDDFAAGRNVALDQAKGDWVLWLNPDEELLPPGADQVRERIAKAGEALGFLVRVQDVPRRERLDQFSETRDLRLFRRGPDLRYQGRLHPTLVPTPAGVFSGQTPAVFASDIIIRRHAYASTLDESKLRWAVRLLERELADRPGQRHYQIEYGRNLLLLGDPKGHEIMAEAIEQVLPAANAGATSAPSPDIQLLLEYAINTPPDVYQGRLPADRAIDLALNWYPDSPPLLWTIAAQYFRAGQYRAAALLLDRLVHLGETLRYDPSHPFDPRIVGPWALLNLGQCQRALGNPGQARQCFEKLLQDEEFREQAANCLKELEASSPPNET